MKDREAPHPQDFAPPILAPDAAPTLEPAAGRAQAVVPFRTAVR